MKIRNLILFSMGLLCMYSHAQTVHDWEQAFTEYNDG